MATLHITPPLFSDANLEELAQASALCTDAISRLIRLVQRLRSFHYEMLDLPSADILKLQLMVANLDAEASLILYGYLVEGGLVDNYEVDLEAIAHSCAILSCTEQDGTGQDDDHRVG